MKNRKINKELIKTVKKYGLKYKKIKLKDKNFLYGNKEIIGKKYDFDISLTLYFSGNWRGGSSKSMIGKNKSFGKYEVGFMMFDKDPKYEPLMFKEYTSNNFADIRKKIDSGFRKEK